MPDAYTDPSHQAPIPTFAGFMKGLASEVLIHLGHVENPITRQKTVNLGMAQYTIGLIDLLVEKTRGNLTAEEDALVRYLHDELRERWLDAVKGSDD